MADRTPPKITLTPSESSSNDKEGGRRTPLSNSQSHGKPPPRTPSPEEDVDASSEDDNEEREEKSGRGETDPGRITPVSNIKRHTSQVKQKRKRRNIALEGGSGVAAAVDEEKISPKPLPKPKPVHLWRVEDCDLSSYCLRSVILMQCCVRRWLAKKEKAKLILRRKQMKKRGQVAQEMLKVTTGFIADMGTLLEAFILPICDMKNSKIEAIRDLSIQLANLRADVQVTFPLQTISQLPSIP